MQYLMGVQQVRAAYVLYQLEQGSVEKAMRAPTIPMPRFFWGGPIANTFFNGFSTGKTEKVHGVTIGPKRYVEPFSANTKRAVAWVINMIISIGLIVFYHLGQDVEGIPDFVLSLAEMIGGMGIFAGICGLIGFALSLYSPQLIQRAVRWKEAKLQQHFGG